MRSEDGNIIHECLNGNSASFGLLVDKYKASIYALAYSKLRNFHDAKDVTQEVFIKALKASRYGKKNGFMIIDDMQ
jgi:RNA polymerase sigma-70 factor (ECF subfamily)